MLKELKDKIAKLLIGCNLVPVGFTGKVTVNFNNGAVCDLEKFERFK